MNAWKKACALLLSLALALSLSACAVRSADAPPEDGEWEEESPEPADILVQPRATPGTAGTEIRLSVEARGEELRYLWQFRRGDGEAWENCSGSGFDSPVYPLTMEPGYDGWQLRCRVFSRGAVVDTETVTLTLIEKPFIYTQPESLSAEAGETVGFWIEAGGGALKYQWYYRDGTADIWKPCRGDGYNKAEYLLTVKSYHDGYQYRCEVKNEEGRVFSSVATLRLR